MLTALKGNIIEALTPDTLGIHPHSFLVLEDGRVVGIYPVLPDALGSASVTDYGDALILQSFADKFLVVRDTSVRIYAGIRFRCIKEVITHLIRFPQRSDGYLFRQGIAGRVGESHAAETDRIDIHVCVSESSFLHCYSLSVLFLRLQRAVKI